AVLLHELDEFGEEIVVEQRLGREIAEHALKPRLRSQTAQQLHAFDQHHIVDAGQEVLALGELQIVARRYERVVAGANAGRGVIKTELAVGQGHDRLEIEFDPVPFDSVAQISQHGVAGSGLGGSLGGFRHDDFICDRLRLGDENHSLLRDHDRLAGRAVIGGKLIYYIINYNIPDGPDYIILDRRPGGAICDGHA